MNVGIVCPYEWTVPGGAGNHVRALATELRRAGHRVDVLAPAERPVAEPGFVGLGGSVGVPYNGSVARIAFGPRTLVRVRRAVARGGYDLLHVHEPLSPSAGLLATVQSGPVPVVATFHANLDRSLALEAAAPLLRRVYDRLGARIAVSASARDTWQRRFGGTMAVVPNGVAPEFFASPKPLDGWEQDGPTILFVGRLEPRKGLEYLVRAFLRLKPAFPRLRLLVVGRDDRDQQAKAMAMVPPRFGLRRLGAPGRPALVLRLGRRVLRPVPRRRVVRDRPGRGHGRRPAGGLLGHRRLPRRGPRRRRRAAGPAP